MELNLIDMMVLNLTTRYGQYLATGENPKPMGNQHSQVFPYQAFPTKDGWMIAGAQTDESWKSFCSLIGREDLAMIEKYKTNSQRVKYREELTSILNEVFMTNTTEDWCNLFEGKNILYGPIWGIHELINSDLIKDHNIIVDVDHPELGKFPLIQTPVQYSRSKVQLQPIISTLGEHSEEVLKEMGYSNEAIKNLTTDQVVSTGNTQVNFVK